MRQICHSVNKNVIPIVPLPCQLPKKRYWCQSASQFLKEMVKLSYIKYFSCQCLTMCASYPHFFLPCSFIYFWGANSTFAVRSDGKDAEINPDTELLRHPSRFSSHEEKAQNNAPVRGHVCDHDCLRNPQAETGHCGNDLKNKWQYKLSHSSSNHVKLANWKKTHI